MILIGLGSSLPFCGAQPQETVRLAMAAIAGFAPVERASRLYRSPAWPDPADPPFVNAVIAVRTGLGPAALLAALHDVEAAFGRRRSARNAPRTLDLDLLAYDGFVSKGAEGGLSLPHPGLPDRDFVLAPLCDIAPDWTSPVSGRMARAMLAALPTRSAIPIE